MGLDSVELVMEVEEHFLVSLPDVECEGVRTVADLAALVIRHLPRDSGVCPEARRFFGLRREIVGATGHPRRDVRPRTPLEAVFPRRSRRRLWARLRRVDRLIPNLVTTSAVDRVLLWVTAAALLTCPLYVALIWVASSLQQAVFLAMLLITGVGTALAFTRARFAVCFPRECATVGDLARVTTPSTIPNARGARLALEQRVLERVRELTAMQLALPIEKVLPESRFVEDLKID